MKDLTIVITPDSDPNELSAAVQTRVAAQKSLSAQDRLVMDELINCVQDFSRRSRDLNRAGTVLRIEKTFQFTVAKVVARLAVPDDRGLIQRFLHKARGNL